LKNSTCSFGKSVPTTATTGKIKVTTPGGSITSTADFVVSTVHSRSVTLTLKKHVVAKGAVNVGDGFTACAASVPVKIQRRVSGSWKNVGSTTTTASGSYSKKVKDKEGKYRAQAPEVTLNNGADICQGDASPVRKPCHETRSEARQSPAPFRGRFFCKGRRYAGVRRFPKA
jgi:hypothetical protein